METKKYLPIAFIILILVIIFSYFAVKNFREIKINVPIEKATNNDMKDKYNNTPKDTIDQRIKNELSDNQLEIKLYSIEDKTKVIGTATILEDKVKTTILIKVDSNNTSDSPMLMTGFCDTPETTVQSLTEILNNESTTEIKLSLKEMTSFYPLIIKTSNACGEIKIL